MSSTGANIIGSQEFIGLTANLPPTLVFGVTETGLYRVNEYFESTESSSGSTQVYWTDIGGNRGGIDSVGSIFASSIIRCVAGSTISVGTFVTDSIPYNLYVTIERL